MCSVYTRLALYNSTVKCFKPIDLKYSGNYTIRTSELVRDKRLSVPAMISLMQEASMQNVIELKASVWDMEKDGISWVLLRKKITIHQYPILGETIRIVTYPSYFDRVFAYRDYKIYSNTGQLIVKASSTWTLLNTVSRKLQKIPDIFLKMKAPEDEEILIPPDSKITRPEKVEFSKEFRIGWYDIDWNNHVNNVYLLKTIIESTPNYILKANRIKEINYHIRAESFFDETLRVEGQCLNGSTLSYKMINLISKKEVAIAEIHWETT
jgi:acyl-ACP thioesterase